MDNRRRGGSRLQGIALLLLLALLAAGAVYAVPAVRYRSEAQRYFSARMLTECDDAVSNTTKLSRTASSNSYSTLAQIRSEVYAMDLLNQMNAGLPGGSFLIPESTLTGLYSLLDSYNSNLITGIATGDLQTELSGALNALRDMLSTDR